MNRILSVVLLVFIACTSTAQQNLLWKITHPKDDKVSYLFGSIHTNDLLLNTFDGTWWKAFNSCSVFAGEVDATSPTGMMEALNAGMLKDTTLADLYTEEEMTKVRNYVLSKLDPAMAMVIMRMKPFYIMAALVQMPDGKGPFSEVMDIRLQTLAKQSSMKVVGLESSVEQASSVASMSLKEQAKMLLEFIEQGDKSAHELKVLEGYYHRQDLDSMVVMAMTMESNNFSPEAMEALIEKRNERFMERLLPHLKENNVFCAVGAMHLPGERGMLAMLRREGYHVEPVPFEFKAE
jgi:uncharacterized protein YbaP (TraB family)